jgi:serine/threonine protein kinase
LGTPSINEVKGSPQGIEFISGLKVSAKRDIADLLPLGTNPLAVDVIQQMLTIDPEKRPSAEQLLQHEYFADMLDEFSMMKAPFRFDNSFEDETNSLESIKSACYQQILKMNDNTTLEEQALGISNI